MAHKHIDLAAATRAVVIEKQQRRRREATTRIGLFSRHHRSETAVTTATVAHR